MSEVDPDPYDPDAATGSMLGGREEPGTGDPTLGGKRGEIGETPGIAADEPSDGSRYPVGGGAVTEEADAAGPDPGAGA